jgi:hypothetical protein
MPAYNWDLHRFFWGPSKRYRRETQSTQRTNHTKVGLPKLRSCRWVPHKEIGWYKSTCDTSKSIMLEVSQIFGCLTVRFSNSSFHLSWFCLKKEDGPKIEIVKLMIKPWIQFVGVYLIFRLMYSLIFQFGVSTILSHTYSTKKLKKCVHHH